MIRFLLGAALLATAPAAFAQDSAPPAVQASLMAPGLRVTDLDRSMKFYGAALGLVPCVTLHHGRLTEVMLCADSRAGKLALILMRDETPGKSPPVQIGDGFQKIVMRVPDLVGVTARMKAAGYAVGEIHTNPGGPSVLMIRDPDGYEFELVGNSRG